MCGIEPKKGVFGNSRLSYDDIFSKLNSISKKYNGKLPKDRLMRKLMLLFHEAALLIVASKYPALNTF